MSCAIGVGAPVSGSSLDCDRAPATVAVTRSLVTLRTVGEHETIGPGDLGVSTFEFAFGLISLLLGLGFVHAAQASPNSSWPGRGFAGTGCRRSPP